MSLANGSGRVDTRVASAVVEMRSALAPDIARLAAIRGGKRTADVLWSIMRQMDAAGPDLLRLQALALEFWEALVDGADNIAYRLAFNALRRAYRCFDHLLTDVLADELADLDSYRAIASAVQAHDADRAEALARELTDLGAAGLSGLIDGLDRAAKGAGVDDVPQP